jgi:hypothetical protein
MKAPKSDNIEFELCPAGSHVATLFKIIYIGTVETEYEGNKSWKPMVKLQWELPNEPKKYTDKDGKEVESVFSISKEMTFSMGKKSNLRPLVEGMVGRALSDDEAFEFDLDTLLGQSCVLNIIHDKSKTTGNPYSKIASAMPLMKGMTAPEAVNPLRIIDVATSPEEDINFLYDKIRDKMKSSKEWLERSTRQAVEKDDWYPTNENEGTAFDLPDDKLPN